jgi:hypothetical protein
MAPLRWSEASTVPGLPGAGFTSRSTLEGDVAEDMDIPAPNTTVAATFVNQDPAQGWAAQMITLR